MNKNENARAIYDFLDTPYAFQIIRKHSKYLKMVDESAEFTPITYKSSDNGLEVLRMMQ